MRLYSYVVRYDSGFAPNPFFGVCTLATCKPDIRKGAELGDWVVGTGSADKRFGRGGFLVYAMQVTESLTLRQYWGDPRFRSKRPNLRGSNKQASGDNIYRWDTDEAKWCQLDSYHSRANGTPNPEHVRKDTGVNRVLASTHFVYFGGHGPKIPDRFRNYNGVDVCKRGQGHRAISDMSLISDFAEWIESTGRHGYVGSPLDWTAGCRPTVAA